MDNIANPIEQLKQQLLQGENNRNLKKSSSKTSKVSKNFAEPSSVGFEESLMTRQDKKDQDSDPDTSTISLLAGDKTTELEDDMASQVRDIAGSINLSELLCSAGLFTTGSSDSGVTNDNGNDADRRADALNLKRESQNESENAHVAYSFSPPNKVTSFSPNPGSLEQAQNPTKKRRLVANARERNRVHTISAAFEAVRTQIPGFVVNQKMSKLSILKIATAYIQMLGAIIEEDDNNKTLLQSTIENVDKKNFHLIKFDNELSRDAIENLTKILKTESRAKKKGLKGPQV